MSEGFRRFDARPQGEVGCAPFRHWLLPDGRPWLEFYRQASGYLLRFPGLADFDVPGGSGPVSCHPAPEVTEDTTTHLFLNQVSPLLASSRGALVFHASVVDCRGSAIAFVGESGRGKSTLAARFATSGYGFLSDDGLAVAGKDGGFFALPGHPSLRLWDDSQAALMREGGTTVLPVQYTEKSRFVATDELLFCNQPRRLRRAYFLADEGAEDIVIEPLGAAESVAQWAMHAFVLDADEKSLMARRFDQLTALANDVAGYRLDFPRRFDMLDAVTRAILAQPLHETEAT